MVGIGLVNDVPRATAAYAATKEEEHVWLQADLTAANGVISELQTTNELFAKMFNLVADSNPVLAQQWRNVRPRIHRVPTPEEQAELERPTEVNSSQLREDLNLH
ncbi:hypothetical protein Bca4012_093018 [Brassica carinata]